MKIRSTVAIAGFFAVALSPVPSALFPATGFGVAQAENSKSNDHASDKDKGKSGKDKDKDKSDKDNGNSGKDKASGTDKDKPDLKGLKAALESDKDRDGWKGDFRDAAKVAFAARVDLVKAYEQVIDARNLLNVDRAALQAAIDAGVDTTDAQAAVDADRAALIKARHGAAVAAARFDAARALERVRLLIAMRGEDFWDDGPLWEDGYDTGSNGSETGNVASELKGLNSSHASASALAHASDKSQVGKNANYLDAATVSVAARADLAKAVGTLGDARAALAADQAMLDAVIKAGGDTTKAQAAVDADTMALNGARYDVVVAEAQLDAAKARERVALLIATDGEQLSPEALAEYRANLGL